MGEYADMFLDGTLDSETGELIDGDSPGYPRRKLKKHSGNRHGPRCPECGKKLRSEQGVRDHRRDAHGIT